MSVFTEYKEITTVLQTGSPKWSFTNLYDFLVLVGGPDTYLGLF